MRIVRTVAVSLPVDTVVALQSLAEGSHGIYRWLAKPCNASELAFRRQFGIDYVRPFPGHFWLEMRDGAEALLATNQPSEDEDTWPESQPTESDLEITTDAPPASDQGTASKNESNAYLGIQLRGAKVWRAAFDASILLSPAELNLFVELFEAGADGARVRTKLIIALDVSDGDLRGYKKTLNTKLRKLRLTVRTGRGTWRLTSQ